MRTLAGGRRVRSLGGSRLVRRVAEEHEHEQPGDRQEAGRHVQRTAPTQVLGRLARDKVGQAERHLVTGPDNADRLAPAEHGVAAVHQRIGSRVELYPGVQHGFWRRTDNDQAGAALDAVAAFLSAL